VRDMLRKWGFESRRGIQSAGEADIEHDVPGWHVEVKNDERLSIWAMLAQAERDAKRLFGVKWAKISEALRPPMDEPVVFFKRNGTKVYAALDAEELLRLKRIEQVTAELIELVAEGEALRRKL